MDSWAEEVLAMARKLPREARLQIAAELQRQDDPGPADDVEAAWREEVVQRIRRFLDGETTMLDGQEVYDNLRAKYAR